jgi:hypothetical protein
MVFKVTKKTTKAELDAWLASLPPSKVEHLNAKVFDASKFKGKLSRKLDGLKLQKQFRNEWN